MKIKGHYNKTIRLAFSFGLAAMFIVGAGVSGVMAQVIYSNGPLSTGTISRSGVTAPGGYNWSEVSYNYGSTTETNTILGFGCQRIGTTTNNRCADNFSVPVGQTWTINSIVTYAYQTGYAGATSPVVAANVQIWNGRPGDAGATVIAGNATSLPFTSVEAVIYRTSNSGPPSNSVPGTTRRVWENTITLSSPAVLTAGTYWVDFQTDTGATGNFTPTMTLTGIRNHPLWNGRQFTGVWADALDSGNPAGAIDVPQEFAFKLNGSVGGAPAFPYSRSLDFNGDNKTDFVVTRAASGVSPTDWWILNSAGAVSQTDHGLGVGIAGGDIPTPADYDGDGKTDIAFWRSGPPMGASFSILNSSTSTISMITFGQTGDDPTIVGDYDGDGKADAAVYRPATNTFFYQGSAGGGSITYVPWGTAGDIAIPGDFDGDGKYDFSVARNTGGQITHWQLRSSEGTGGFDYGLNTDKYVTGDFDGDGRDDIAAVRSSMGSWNWYILKSSTLQTAYIAFGNPVTDYLVPADYDGDGKSDIAVWRSGGGAPNTYFFVLNSNSSPVGVQWGSSSTAQTPPDYPAAAFTVK